jgi:hypothetical protein
MLCRQTRCLTVRSDPTVTAIVCNAASPLLRAACAWRCSTTVKRHFPFSSTRFNPIPLLESVRLLSLNMFTSLHDTRSASTNEKHASQRRKHFVLSCRCDAVTRRVQQSASKHHAIITFCPLTDDVCAAAGWRDGDPTAVFECCGRPRMSLDESAMLTSCSNTSHDAITCGRSTEEKPLKRSFARLVV